MNEINIFWKKITKGLPTAVQASDDRPPTVEEIQELIKDYPDRRLKVIVLVMLSSGIRIGAWNYLKWKHIEPIYDEKNSEKGKEKTPVAAKITVYAGTREKYYSFLTPEAYKCIREWIDYRSLHGESISDESWLMRDTWQKIDRSHGHRIGLAKFPKKFDSEGIRTLIDKAWKIQGIREKLNSSRKHHNFKSSHGFRKFFQTNCEQVMISANVERLMGHSNGLKDSYYKPTEKEVLKDYLNACDLLTIGEENKLKYKMEKIDKNNDNQIKKEVEANKEIINQLTKKHENELNQLREEMSEKFKEIMKMVQENPILSKVKPEVLQRI